MVAAQKKHDVAVPRPVDTRAADAKRDPMGAFIGFEVQLVLEFCDHGSLRSQLDAKTFIDPLTGEPHFQAVLEVSEAPDQ